MAPQEANRGGNPTERAFVMRGEVILSHLPRIPTLRSHSIMDELDSEFNKMRKDSLDALVRIAHKEAAVGISPSPLIAGARPQIMELFGTHDQVEMLLGFSEASAKAGENPSELIAAASEIANLHMISGRYVYSTQHWARIAETYTRIDQDENASEAIQLAGLALISEISRANGNPLAEVGTIDPTEKVVKAMLHRGDIDGAKRMLSKVPWDNVRDHIMEDLAQDFAAVL